MPRWTIHARVWCRFYDADSDAYVPGVDGFIRRVYGDGSADYVNRQQQLEVIPVDSRIHWPTREECEQEIATHPRPATPTINERVAKG